jgi:nucleoside-diphosphate-sugar epimerase
MRAALAGGARRFIQESFAPIYPDQGEEWIDERAPFRPARYNRGVIDAEVAAEHFTRSGGTGIVLRFAYLYGPDSDYTRDAIRLVRRRTFSDTLAEVLGSVREGWRAVVRELREAAKSLSNARAA